MRAHRHGVAISRLARTLAGALLATVLATSGGATAHAEVLEATCTGTSTVHYTPGLRLAPRTVDVDGGRQYDCLSATVSSGVSSFALDDVERGCLSAAPSAHVETITWDDGSSSVLSGTVTVVNAAGTTVVTKTGTVTAGRFLGAAVLQVNTGPTISGLLDCLTTTGLTTITETTVLEITSL
ncbi:hypothetical protein ACH436_14925 [Isoptericola sp. NPDC019693]|uniref:hypothetical protein n=1 Tax=Isoptericola sp. NPDC019693 TaxID=3364009 RepID=UPI0037B24D00